MTDFPHAQFMQPAFPHAQYMQPAVPHAHIMSGDQTRSFNPAFTPRTEDRVSFMHHLDVTAARRDCVLDRVKAASGAIQPINSSLNRAKAATGPVQPMGSTTALSPIKLHSSVVFAVRAKNPPAPEQLPRSSSPSPEPHDTPTG